MVSPTPSKLNLQDHPWLFGVYANQARHNVFQILHHVAERTGDSSMIGEEDNMWQASVLTQLTADSNKRPERTRKTIELLYEHFPFLRSISGVLKASNPHPEKYFDVMHHLLKHLQHYRNQYSHAVHLSQHDAPAIFDWLDIIYDDALRVVKERFELDEANLKHLQRLTFDRKKKKNVPSPGFAYKLHDGSSLTEKGLAFFISLFLEKEHSIVFLKKLKNFKRAESEAERATLEVFTCMGCKMPHVRLQSAASNYKDTLLLDMLNELQRCPVDLYEHLAEDDRRKFIANLDALAESAEEGGAENETNLTRKQDRFPYFALRYIDANHLFQKLRFHIDLGNHTFHSYSQNIAGETFPRRWQRKLLTFARLQDATEQRPEEWENILYDPADINDDTPAPYLAQTNPHYHFDVGNIGLREVAQQDPIWPKRVETGKPKIEKADFYLSTDELPGLLFYNHLVRKYKGGKEAENVIFQHRQVFHKFLRAIESDELQPVTGEKITRDKGSTALAKLLDEGSYLEELNKRKAKLVSSLVAKGILLQPHQLPEKLSRYLMAIEPIDVEKRALAVLEEMLEETKLMLERVEKPKERSKKTERRRSRSEHTRAGEVALFLAKDMLFLQPSHQDSEGLSKDKANSTEFQVLQAQIAFFGRDKGSLVATFKLCNLIESKNPHPFLHEIQLTECRDSQSFYKEYLHHKISYLETLIAQQDFKSPQFLQVKAKEKKRSTQYFKGLAKNIREEHPINLPRGLFRAALLEMIRKNKIQEFQDLVMDKEHNTIYLLQKYFEYHQDGHQPFYAFKRNYRVVDKVRDTRSEKNRFSKLKKNYLNVSQLVELGMSLKDKSNGGNEAATQYSYYRTDVIENEKRLRHLEACDKMLFIMCKEMLFSGTTFLGKSAPQGISLKDITPDNEKSILNHTHEFEFEIFGKTVKNQFKIKKYGNFRRLLKDRRLPALLSHVSEKTIQLSWIVDEFKHYEKLRLKLFETIYNFELACQQHPLIGPMMAEEVRKQGYTPHSCLLKQFAAAYPSEQSSIAYLALIRNRLSHNQLPNHDDVAEKGALAARDVIEGLVREAIEKYKEFISLMIAPVS